jgi:hypothetical protein
MRYLDVSPMIVALRDSPNDFEILAGRLHHIPSRHSFRFGPDDEVEIGAACDCALLEVDPAQKRELIAGYVQWEREYWRPLAINREFATHFRRPLWRQALISLCARAQRWLMSGPRSRRVAEGLAQTG